MNPGDEVRFRHKGMELAGTVLKVNRKTVSVLTAHRGSEKANRNNVPKTAIIQEEA